MKPGMPSGHVLNATTTMATWPHQGLVVGWLVLRVARSHNNDDSIYNLHAQINGWLKKGLGSNTPDTFTFWDTWDYTVRRLVSSFQMGGPFIKGTSIVGLWGKDFQITETQSTWTLNHGTVLKGFYVKTRVIPMLWMYASHLMLWFPNTFSLSPQGKAFPKKNSRCSLSL